MNTVVPAFEQILENVGLLVARGQMPSGGGWTGTPGASRFNRYGVIHPLKGATDGPANLPDQIIAQRIQVTVVGATASSTEFYAEQVRLALVGQRISTATRTTLRPIWLDEFGEVDRDDTVKPSVFMVPHIFGVTTTPAS